MGRGLGKPGRPYEVKVILKGYFIDGKDTPFWDTQGEAISVTLGDEGLPYGLWKSIELMRREERSLIMIKPKWAYGRPESQGFLRYPTGWDHLEGRETIGKRRVYFEVKLLDWCVKHDLDGDGSIIKSIFTKGIGYDRPYDYDEFTIDLKIYQNSHGESEAKVYYHNEAFSSLMTD